MKPGCVVVIAIMLCSCKSNQGKGLATGADNASEPIACKSSADCPRRACGPCKPGEILGREAVAVECYRNPCTNDRSVCNPQGRCAVHPDTKNVDDIHSVECRALFRDKWSILCKDKQGSDLEACENVTDRAIARDDDAGCRAARAQLGQ